MGYILFLIESPGKVEKLTHVLGDNYKVMATVGHIIDLDPSKMSVDFKHDFEPTYIEIPDKLQVIDKIKKAAAKADDIYLAADEDREGEMIAWSVAKILKLDKPKRVTYNSITKDEILKAVKNPRTIDQSLVNAQKSRRILDRIMGYELSPLLLKVLKITHLSAGRVQSVVTRLIVDREEEIKKFFDNDIPSVFKFAGVFKTKETYNAILHHISKDKKKEKQDVEEDDEKETNDDDNIKDSKSGVVKIISQSKAEKLMYLFKKSHFTIGNITEKSVTRHASPPFTTSTLQQEASRKLGFAIKRTMSAAQSLYEAGYITYMRTDSTNLSNEAIGMIGKYIVETYGKEYHKSTQYAAKNKNTQEAHEAIRPTNVKTVDDLKGKKIGNDEFKLYNLIWKRSVASQMAPAIINKVTVHTLISETDEYAFLSEIETIKFPGFLKVYNITNIEEENESSTTMMLKIPKIGQEVELVNINSSQTYQKPPSRYNEASLVNKLDPKNLNIGRPATYASIITKIHEREYVKDINVQGVEKNSVTIILTPERKIETNKMTIIIGNETNKIVPTSLGIMVTKFLVDNFPEMMDYQFTSHMEDSLDEIANGSLNWVKVMNDFYDRFHPIVEKVKKETKELVKKNIRIIGKHPETNQEIVATIRRYGPVVEMKKDSKYIRAPIKEPLTLETITLNDALKLFEYPKLIGKYEGVDILLNRGKYGHYITYDKEKISIGDETDITLDQAITAIKERKSKFLWEGADNGKIYKILNGPYGVYVNISGKGMKKATNVKLPKDINIGELTIEKLKDIITERYATKKTYRGKKKSSVATGGKYKK